MLKGFTDGLLTALLKLALGIAFVVGVFVLLWFMANGSSP